MRGPKHICLWGLVVVALGLGTGDLSAQEPSLESYLPLFPANTNSLMVLHVDDIKKSAKAASAGWNKKDSSLWLAGTDPLPYWITTIVRGAHSHLQRSSRDWTLNVTPLPDGIPFSALVRNSGQKTQLIHDRPVFLSSEGMFYVAALTEDKIGVITPADRADLADWILLAQQNTEPVIPDYLQEAAKTPGDVVLAYDLVESIDVWILRNWLKSTETLKGQNSQVQAMSDMLESIEGITLAITVTDKISADLTIDFQTPLSSIADKFHPLLHEYLKQQGAVIEDLRQAEVELQEQSIVLKMDPLSDSGFQRLLSLVLAPSTAQYSPPPESATSPSTPADQTPKPSSEPDVQSTEKYYDAIENMLGDLEKKTGPNYLGTAVWHERYAAKIDHLPIRGVDPEMLKYGRETSARLVALAASLRGTPLEINALNNSVTYKVTPHWGNGWWGGGGGWTTSGQIPSGYTMDSNLAQVREQQAQAVMEGTKERDQLWQIQIDQRNAIRQAMYQKYGVDFGEASDDEKTKKR